MNVSVNRRSRNFSQGEPHNAGRCEYWSGSNPPASRAQGELDEVLARLQPEQVTAMDTRIERASVFA
jgi:hypothetical protein